MANVDRDFEFPAELLVQPQALVGISGLDPLNNAIHRTVWDALSAGRRTTDRPPVQFKLLAASHEFPRPKPKKSYEQHIPKGILKRGWMHKHLTQVPSVVVVFSDLDWDDPQWDGRKMECVSRVQSMRLALEGRGTKICVVLIQSKTPSPSVEDTLGAERAKEIFQAADLSNKSLYILPHNDHLLGFTAKLETAFYDLAKTYYQHEIRQIRTHRESLNKKNHQYLYVRHHFKIAFFSELRQDLAAAHINYEEAYNNLLEARLLDTNEFEVKTIAGYISYKVSRVHFGSNRPRDAISHFRAHIEHYKLRMGHPLLRFQDYAWLSKQFSMFAELLEDMGHQGFTSVQTQHPGFYYKSAAKYSEMRKRMAYELCRNVAMYPAPDPLANWDRLEFYGQRPWRPCQLSAEPLDPDLERQGIQALQYNELHRTDQSGIIISLLGSAISQFKKYKCPRMRRHLVVQMADEYYEAKDYGKSLTLLTHMLWDYRMEKWYCIVDRLLVKALATAFLSAAVSEYLSLCLEAVSRSDPSESSRVCRNLKAVTEGGVPEPEPNLPIEGEAIARKKWIDAKSESPTVVVDTSLFVSPVQLKASIVVHEYNKLQIHITVRSRFPEPVEFSSFRICLTSPSSPKPVEHEISTPTKTLMPLELQTFVCDCEPDPSDVGKIVQISSVQIVLGRIVGRTVILSFNGLGTDPNSTYPELMAFKQARGPDLEFLRVRPCLSSVISRRDPLVSMKIAHKAPALLAEWYPVRVTLENNEASSVSDAFLTFNLGQNVDKNAATATEFADLTSLLSFPVNVKVEFCDGKFDQTFFVKSDSISTRILDVRLSYVVDGHCCISESTVSFEVVEPFDHSSKFLSVNFVELQEIYTIDVFRLENRITGKSQVPVVIESARLELLDHITKEGVRRRKTAQERESSASEENFIFDPDPKCHLEGVILSENEWVVDVASLRASSHSGGAAVSICKLHLTWSRLADKDAPVRHSSTVVELPPVVIRETQLSVRLHSPGNGVVRQFYPVKFAVSNHTNRLHVLHFSVDPSEFFVYAGFKECTLYVRPKTTKELEFNMVSMHCGEMALPSVQLRSADDSIPQMELDTIVRRAMPEYVLIFPQSRQPLKEADTQHNSVQIV